MLSFPELGRWVEHRVVTGRRMGPLPPALEKNVGARTWLITSGRREFRGFVGFVDLVGFSTQVKGQSPAAIAGYLEPFLTGVLSLLLPLCFFVDKTIGDEVMMVRPDEEDFAHLVRRPCSDALPAAGAVVGGLWDLQRSLGVGYRFRLGLAYGSLFISHVKGGGFDEWTAVGEAVHLAKRMHSLPSLETELTERMARFGGAVGVLRGEMDAPDFARMISSMSVSESIGIEMIEGVVESLKGVSPALCARVFPRA